MTILTQEARTLALGVAGLENNPLILWDNKATASNISSVTGVATDGAASNAVNGTTFDFALPLVSVGNSAALSLSTVSEGVNAGAIASHNLGTLGATVALEYSDDSGATWHDCGAGSITPTDDQAIMWNFSDQAGMEWRLIATNVTSGQPAIGVFILTDALVVPERMYQGYTPPITPTNITLQSNVSEGNHLLGNSFTRQGSSISVQLDYLSDAFIRSAAWKGFQEHFNHGKGIFWAWRPAKYGDVFYGWRTGNTIRPTNSGPKALMSAGFDLRLYHDE